MSQCCANSPVSQSLSPSVLEIAHTIGVLPLIEQLHSAQQAAKTIDEADTLKKLAAKQRIIYLHTKISQYMQVANLELSSIIGKLNSGMAQLADSKAMISDERAKMLRRNTFINLISGGLTKIGGYSSALTPASPIPTNVLEVFDGGVQVLLSASTMRQQRSESKFYSNKPTVLTIFIRGKNSPTAEYPDSVWDYLNKNTTEAAANKSRRQILIDAWIRTGRLISANSEKGKQRNAAQSSAFARQKIILDDIDDAVAMMSDIKSTVSTMESILMELSHFIKASYRDDPEF